MNKILSIRLEERLKRLAMKEREMKIAEKALKKHGTATMIINYSDGIRSVLFFKVDGVIREADEHEWRKYFRFFAYPFVKKTIRRK